MGKPTLVQAFAQNSTMTIDTAKLLAGDAIQALNHKDLNGGLHLPKVLFLLLLLISYLLGLYSNN